MPPGLAQWRTDMERAVPLTHLQLGPITAEDILRYMFAHAKIRAVVYAEASEARRSIFHRRALEALQVAAAPAAVLAYHALAARLAEPAFRWSLAAGDEAL